MTIGYFPVLFPDELFYSALARYNYDIGNTVYRNFSRTFFADETARADIEFINKLSPTSYECITRQTSMEEIIHCHTMYDYYIAFVPQERRRRAYDAICRMDAKLYRQLIPVPHSGSKRVLRYCPMCAERDREKHGNTFWHRSAQMIGVNICPIHHCYLINTQIEISSKETPTILAAEQVIPPQNELKMTYDTREILFAQYCFSVMQNAANIRPDNDIHLFLQSKLVGTPYLSVRKKIRNMELLYSDLARFADSTNLPSFQSLSALKQFFKGTRFSPAEFCFLGLFLGISSEDMLTRNIPNGIMENTADEEIKRLHREGWNYAQISRKVGIGYDVVKLIDYGRYGSSRKPHSPPKSKCTLINWTRLDEEYLPKIKHEIRRMERTDTLTRPKYVCPGTVSKLVGLPEQRIFKMPKCLAYIQTRQCSREVYNARVIDWGKKQLVREGLPVTVNELCKITNLKRSIVDAINN